MVHEIQHVDAEPAGLRDPAQRLERLVYRVQMLEQRHREDQVGLLRPQRQVEHRLAPVHQATRCQARWVARREQRQIETVEVPDDLLETEAGPVEHALRLYQQPSGRRGQRPRGGRQVVHWLGVDGVGALGAQQQQQEREGERVCGATAEIDDGGAREIVAADLREDGAEKVAIALRRECIRVHIGRVRKRVAKLLNTPEVGGAAEGLARLQAAQQLVGQVAHAQRP